MARYGFMGFTATLDGELMDYMRERHRYPDLLESRCGHGCHHRRDDYVISWAPHDALCESRPVLALVRASGIISDFLSGPHRDRAFCATEVQILALALPYDSPEHRAMEARWSASVPVYREYPDARIHDGFAARTYELRKMASEWAVTAQG
jgi:hypothetical protein